MSKRFAGSALAVVSVVGGLGGCVPVARIPPAYLAETATALPRGQVAVTGAAGAGFDISGTGGGASARVRVGIGDHQEIGIEGSRIAVQTQIDQGFFDPEPSTYIDSKAYAARVSWKDAVTDHVALILGTGAAYTTRTGGDDTDTSDYRGLSLTADAGFVASGRKFRGFLSPYVGGRITLTTPATDPLDTGASTAIVGTLSAGLAAELSPSARVFVEAGTNSTFVHSTGDDANVTIGDSLFSTGPYGLLGLGVTFGN